MKKDLSTSFKSSRAQFKRVRFFLYALSVIVALTAVSCGKHPTEEFGAPHSLSASDGSFVDRVHISWDSVSGAEKYIVYRSTTVDGTYSKLGTSAINSYDDYDAIPSGTVFYYKATAWSYNDGESGFSNNDSGSVGSANSLVAPTINVTAATSQINVSWNTITGATKYYIYRQAPTDPDYALIANVATLGYADTTAKQGVSYDYKVRAWSTSGFSNYSGALSGQIGSALAAPAGVNASQNQFSQITVSWGAVAGASNYTVYRAPASTGPYEEIVSGVAGLSYNDPASELTQGKYYYYTVQAVAGSQVSPVSALYGTGLALPSLIAPVINAVSGTGNVVLSWSDVSGASDYDIYRSNDGGLTFPTMFTTNVSNYSDTPPSANFIYYYKVKARNSDGSSIFSNTVSGYSGAATNAPGAPGSLGYISASNSITLSWSAPPQTVTGYRIYRSTDGLTYTLLDSCATTTYTNNSTTPAGFGPVNGQNYWYRVSAVNSGVEGLAGAPLMVNIPVTVATPVVTGGAVTVSSIALNVSIIGDLRYIYRSSTSGGDYVLIGNTATGSFTDTQVQPGTAYYYKARAYSATDGYSNISAPVSVSSQAITVPAITSATTTNADRIVLTWANFGATTYYIYRSNASAGDYNLIATTAALTYTDYNVEPGGTYYYKLQTYTTGTGYSALSSDVMGGTIGSLSLAVPGSLVASDGSASGEGGNSSQIHVTCGTVASATVYYVYRSTAAAGTYEYRGNTTTPVTGFDDTTMMTRAPSYGVRYWYKIKAYDATTHAFSNYTAATDGFLQNPTMTCLASDGSSAIPPVSADADSEVAIAWSNPAYADTFDVYRNGTLVASNQTGTAYNDTGITQSTNGGIQFSYKVLSRNSALGANSTSDLVSTTADSGYLKLPVTTIASVSQGTNTGYVSVSWNAGTNATLYDLYRSTTPTGTYTVVAGATGLAGLTFNDTSAAAGQTYYYEVIARNALTDADSSLSSASGAGYRQLAAPAAPTVTTGTSATQVTVTWSAVTGADEYDVRRDISTGGTFATVVGSNVAGLTFNDTTAAAGTTYYYKIVAKKSTQSGADSLYGAVSTGGYIKLTTPGAPVATTGTYTGYVEVTWSAVAGADRYDVRRDTSTGGAFATVVGLNVAGTSYNDTGAVAGTTYYYKIVAKNSGQTGADSAYSSVSGTGYKQLAAPTAPAVTAGSSLTQVTVTWSSVAGADRYDVCRDTSAGGTFTTVVGSNVSGTSYPDTSAVAGTTYYYKLIAKNSLQSGADSLLGAVSSAGYIKLATPGAPSAVNNVTYITVTWSPVTGADEYDLYRATAVGGPYNFVTGGINISSITFDDSLVLNGNTYFYRIVAKNSLQSGADSAQSGSSTGVSF